MVYQGEFDILTSQYNQFIPIGDKVAQEVEKSGIKSGVVYVITAHTTTGITVNEKLECLEDDLLDLLAGFAPEDGTYYHARFLHSYGAMAGNPTGHMKSMITGNHCVFPIVDGKMKLGAAQEIYLGEFDGPQDRTIRITVMGEK
ncbi:secondary thiamine-phosphate synthase enzyme YjbQ [Youxingia wuxianensis]|uniref:YjbQ family protein n=1 Tax=Youxingia wuxianensis TaxID=2763678 RepID=A0A926III5_9FIRM|nr:secondary thiamine-phosphate synthase enzyme YjbQ [Youxingia wuxianensis]MBC8586396.1 YjbQ family protein [Youxingia wuxianensis]